MNQLNRIKIASLPNLQNNHHSDGVGEDNIKASSSESEVEEKCCTDLYAERIKQELQSDLFDEIKIEAEIDIEEPKVTSEFWIKAESRGHGICPDQSTAPQSVPKSFACDICDYKCGRLYNLKQHKYRHSGTKPLNCSHCWYRCLTRAKLKLHEYRHSLEKPLKCGLCEYACITSTALTRHKYQHDTKPFECDLCDYKCTTSYRLKMHKYRHSDWKPFECDSCNYKCITPDRLKIHKYKHSGEKPFGCDLCEYKCTTAQQLRVHKYFKHSVEDPF